MKIERLQIYFPRSKIPYPKYSVGLGERTQKGAMGALQRERALEIRLATVRLAFARV